MNNIDNPFEMEPIPPRIMPLIFMVETSDDMKGEKIAMVNTAIRQVLSDIGEISSRNADAQIKVGVLQFSDEARWMYDDLIDAESFEWKDLAASGAANFGAACVELNDKLSMSHGWMDDPCGMRSPVIILLSNGHPSDEWESSLKELKDNLWFRVSCKIALSLEDGVLAKFTGSAEAVFIVKDIDVIKKVVRAVIVTASMVNSIGDSLDWYFIKNSTKPDEPEPHVVDTQGTPVVILPDTDEIVYWWTGTSCQNPPFAQYHIKKNSICLEGLSDGESFEGQVDLSPSVFSELLAKVRSLNLKSVPEWNDCWVGGTLEGLELYRNGEMYFSCYTYEGHAGDFVSDEPLNSFVSVVRELSPDESIVHKSVRQDDWDDWLW